MAVILELKDVNKSFGGVQAVKDMSFKIESGELAGLIVQTEPVRLQYSIWLQESIPSQAEIWNSRAEI